MKKTIKIIAAAMGVAVIAIAGARWLYPKYAAYRQWKMQSHCYDFPATMNGWEKYGDKPVYGDEQSGTVFDPYCFMEDSLIRMVVSHRPSASLVSVVSCDGINWSSPTTLLEGVEGTWESIVNRGCLVPHNGEYWLWYTGQNNGESAIGLAKSTDGVNFRRVEGNPVLRPEFTHELPSVMNPCVIWDEGKGVFKMWYSAGETYEPNVICYAESPDGMNWTKTKEPVLTSCPGHLWEKDRIGGCQVIFTPPSHYEMYYIGYQNVHVARICYATGSDGINWSRTDNNLLISPSEGSWDSHAVYKPTVLTIGDTLFLWYNGRNTQGEYIGLAQKRLIHS